MCNFLGNIVPSFLLLHHKMSWSLPSHANCIIRCVYKESIFVKSAKKSGVLPIISSLLYLYSFSKELPTSTNSLFKPKIYLNSNEVINASLYDFKEAFKELSDSIKFLMSMTWPNNLAEISSSSFCTFIFNKIWITWPFFFLNIVCNSTKVFFLKAGF